MKSEIRHYFITLTELLLFTYRHMRFCEPIFDHYNQSFQWIWFQYLYIRKTCFAIRHYNNILQWKKWWKLVHYFHLEREKLPLIFLFIWNSDFTHIRLTSTTKLEKIVKHYNHGCSHFKTSKHYVGCDDIMDTYIQCNRQHCLFGWVIFIQRDACTWY